MFVRVFGATVAVVAVWWLWWVWSCRRMASSLPEPLPLGRRQNWQEGRVILVYGRLGSGKTALVMQRAVKFARANRLPLIANAAVRPDVQVLRSWADLGALQLCTDVAGRKCVNDMGERPCPGCSPGVIVLDEVHLWLPSQAGLMPADQVREAIHLLSYARKRGWLVLATTQYPTRVSTQFRYNCTEMIEVKPFSQGFVHYQRVMDPDTGKPILGFAGVFNPRKARYDSRAEVLPLWSLDDGKGVPGGRARPATAPS